MVVLHTSTNCRNLGTIAPWFFSVLPICVGLNLSEHVTFKFRATNQLMDNLGTGAAAPRCNPDQVALKCNIRTIPRASKVEITDYM